MEYHALYVIFEKAAKFEIVVCCKFLVALYGLNVSVVNSVHHGSTLFVCMLKYVLDVSRRLRQTTFSVVFLI